MSKNLKIKNIILIMVVIAIIVTGWSFLSRNKLNSHLFSLTPFNIDVVASEKVNTMKKSNDISEKKLSWQTLFLLGFSPRNEEKLVLIKKGLSEKEIKDFCNSLGVKKILPMQSLSIDERGIYFYYGDFVFSAIARENEKWLYTLLVRKKGDSAKISPKPSLKRKPGDSDASTPPMPSY